MVEESLVATRKRRANAGSRLKQLLQAEEVAQEDADDVDLLFQEDEDDDEFKVGDQDKYAYVGGDVDEDDDGEGEGSDGEEAAGQSGRGREEEKPDDESGSDVQMEDNDDEMFSDSDSDSDSEDSDVGEKELQKAERAKKREKAKKARQVPKIKTPAIKPPPKPKKIYAAPKAETLLSEQRRSSSRKTAVQNKLDLVERLKDEEARRKSLKPVAKVVYTEMTQEERLAEALETEKYNISTLNKYHEQEIDKQKRRKELMMSKRRQLENVVSFKTLARFVTIKEEHELERFYLTRDKLKKKDRRGRKSDKQKREEEEARKREEEKQRKLEELQRRLDHNQELVDGEPAHKKLKTEDTSTIEDNEIEFLGTSPQTNGDDEVDLLRIERTSGIAKEKQDEEAEEAKEEEEEEEQEANEEEEKEEEGHEEAKKRDKEEVGVDKERNEAAETEAKVEANGDNEDSITEQEARSEAEDIEMKDADANITIKTEEPTLLPQESSKISVMFANDTKQDITVVGTKESGTKESSRAVTTDFEEIVYEGPEEKVGANYITFENVKLKVDDIKTFLFGQDALLGPSRRFRDLEPVLRIKKAEDDVEAITEDVLKEIKVVDLEVLDSFPVFGDFNRVRKEKVVLETRQDIKIVLKTQSPSGIYLPNGSKKKCVITGKPAMYFDPKTGMPYSSVESYKVIKHIQEGGFAWVDFPLGGAYVCDRVNTRHASGVPQGFDE